MNRKFLDRKISTFESMYFFVVAMIVIDAMKVTL